MRTRPFLLLVSLIAVCCSGCGRWQEPTAKIVSGDSTPIGENLSPDSAVSGLVRPYAQEMQASMGEVIGEAESTITKGRPESPLGNFVADALLAHARFKFEDGVDLAVINNGGLRLPSLQKGPIAVGDIYQLVPFDNRVVLLKMTGDQIAALVRGLADRGGEPMAGVSYTITRDRSDVTNIQIDGAALVADQIYGVATVDYLASIGGEFDVFMQASERLDDSDYLRDAVIRYVRQRAVIRPTTDGRVVYERER